MHITRRVYRSGEGEYLINRQPCRLRDIRDLFAGTGMATEAYSVIEQGKVDVLLQSSPRDRRLIFEEAAGISRFKAKKIEALRRLETRRAEPAAAVRHRRRSREPAAKRAGSGRQGPALQGIRRPTAGTAHANRPGRLAHVWATAWRPSITRFNSSAPRLPQRPVRPPNAEALCESLEQQIGEIDSEIHAVESRLSECRQRTATIETTIEHERLRAADLESQLVRHRTQLQALTNRASDLVNLWQSTQVDLQAAEERHREVGSHLADQQRALTALTAQLDQIRSENEQRRSSHLEQLRTAASLTSETDTWKAVCRGLMKAGKRWSTARAEMQANSPENGRRIALRLPSVSTTCRSGLTKPRPIEHRLAKIWPLPGVSTRPGKKNWPPGASVLAEFRSGPRCWKNWKNGTKGSSTAHSKCSDLPKKIVKGRFSRCADYWPICCK